jgi:hypothetical protein
MGIKFKKQNKPNIPYGCKLGIINGVEYIGTPLMTIGKEKVYSWSPRLWNYWGDESFKKGGGKILST